MDPRIRNAWRYLESLVVGPAEEALSHNDTRSALELALRSEHPTPGDGYWLWIRDVYDTEVIYEYTTPNDGTLYRRTYTLSDDGAVTFGPPEAVTAQTVYQPVASAQTESIALTSDVVPLIEKAVRRDNTVSIKVIDAGQGSSGYYSEEMLKRDGPVVFTSGTHMYLDHPTETEAQERPERSVSELAGTFVSNAAWDDNGAAGPGLYADAEIFSPFRDVLDEIAPHIGVSIRARGRAEEGEVDGKRTRVITSLEQADSVDFVTRAGRGGSVVSLAESARGVRRTDEPQEVPVSEQALTEAQAQITAQAVLIQRLTEQAVIRDATAQVQTALASSSLHQMTRDRLRESLVAMAPVVDGALDSAAFATTISDAITAAEAEYAAITGSGQVRNMGGGDNPPATDYSTAMTEAFSALGLDDAAAAIAVKGRS